jgi:hypothetical protein
MDIEVGGMITGIGQDMAASNGFTVQDPNDK